MMRRIYIHQHPDGLNLHGRHDALNHRLASVRHRQGLPLDQMGNPGSVWQCAKPARWVLGVRRGSYAGTMTRKPYSGDWTNAQWEKLAPLLPPGTTRGHHRTTDLREEVNGILYALRWRHSLADAAP